jgi:hypothetical protein
MRLQVVIATCESGKRSVATIRDQGFNPVSGFAGGILLQVSSLALQEDGKIIAAGAFKSYNRLAKSRCYPA